MQEHESAKPAVPKGTWKRGGGKVRETVVGPTASDTERADLAKRLTAFVDSRGLSDGDVARRVNLVEPLVKATRNGACVLHERERERFEKLLSTES